MNISDIPIYEQCKKLEAENGELKALIAQRDESITAQAEIILELKAENVEIKTSYINFIAKLKREMITKEDIQDLKHTVKKFVEERNSLRLENERLKEEKSKLLSKCIDKQCRINELINIVSTKEFTLKVNGKKYEGLNGIDKAKLFINNENAVRDNYIKKLENKISELQYKFYENCKKVVEAQKQIEKYKQTLQEIKEELEEDTTCESRECGCDDYGECLNCLKEIVLTKITKAEEE